MSGVLYVVPTPIADAPLDAVLPSAVAATVGRIDHFLAENAKSARTFLRLAGHPHPLRDLSSVEIGHAPDPERIDAWLAPLAQGHDIALVLRSAKEGSSMNSHNMIHYMALPYMRQEAHNFLSYGSSTC